MCVCGLESGQLLPVQVRAAGGLPLQVHVARQLQQRRAGAEPPPGRAAGRGARAAAAALAAAAHHAHVRRHYLHLYNILEQFDFI